MWTKQNSSKHEQTSPARNAQHHGAQLPDHLLSLLDGGMAMGGSGGVQDFKKNCKAVQRELYLHGHHFQ
jgi:hypothetical protein